ncbi:MAG: DUF1700 domain-containing protein [Hespellia sp.]|nr:DUF1700 domain-containing protein [Hespellia sp.]
MTKTEYLEQMKKYLKRLSPEDYQNTMDYFTEYFDEVGDGNVENAIQELGTPKQAASELLGQLLGKQLADDSVQQKPSSIGKNILIAILAIFAAPIGLPLLFTAVAVIGTGIICVACVLLCGFVGVFSIVIVAGKVLVRGMIASLVSIPGALILIGVGLLGIGISILLGIFVIALCKWIGKGIAVLAGKISGKVRR